MRFRLGEDERLYETLRAEIYLRLLPSLPKTTLSEVMRNMQKLEAMSYGEGIKQGMAVAALSAANMPAIAQHASFYGDAATPLARVEEAAMPPVMSEAHPWVRAERVQFPPQTLAEAIAAYGPTLDPSKPLAGVPTRNIRIPAPVEAQEAQDDLDLPEEPTTGSMVDVQQLFAMNDEIAAEEAAAIERGEDRAQSPDLLDRIRTQIKADMRDGWDPKTWPELILRLMVSMQMDAAAIDLQLGGEQGRAVLDQCGLHNINPGAGVVVDGDGNFVGVRT